MSSSDGATKRRSFRLTLFARFALGLGVLGALFSLLLWHFVVPRITDLAVSLAPRDEATVLPIPPPEANKVVIESLRIFDEMGLPPKQEIATRLSAEGYQIGYWGPISSWATGADLPSWERVKEQTNPFPPHPAFRVGRSIIARQIGEHRIALFFPFDFPRSPVADPGFQIALLGHSIVVILLCLAFAHWQFRPLRALTATAKRITAGELGLKVGITQSSEIGDLSQAFDEMSERVKYLVRAREDLLADLSHELRSPLARVRMAIEIGDDESRGIIRESIREMDSLVSQLLERHRFERAPDTLDAKAFSLDSLVAEVVKAYAASGRMITTSAKEPALVCGDRERIRRVLVNLIDNAIKYSTGEITVSVTALGEKVSASVRDRGAGVPEDKLSAIFEPFRRLDRSRSKATGGFGLGLDLCRRIVEAHGGQIHASNHPQGGLEVTFSLPSAAAVELDAA